MSEFFKHLSPERHKKIEAIRTQIQIQVETMTVIALTREKLGLSPEGMEEAMNTQPAFRALVELIIQEMVTR